MCVEPARSRAGIWGKRSPAARKPLQWEKWKARDRSRDLFALVAVAMALKWVEEITELKYELRLGSDPKLHAAIELALETVLFFFRWFSTNWIVAVEQQKVNIKIKSHLSRDWAKSYFFCSSNFIYTSKVNIHSFVWFGRKREIKSSFVFFVDSLLVDYSFFLLLHHT